MFAANGANACSERSKILQQPLREKSFILSLRTLFTAKILKNKRKSKLLGRFFLQRRSASSSVFATPKLLTSLKPPRLLSTTTTLMVLVLFFFLCGNMPQRYTNFLSHPSHQSKFPVYRGFKWVMLSEMLKPPKSGVVDSFKDIIYIHCLVSDTDSICFKDIARLIMS